MSQFLERFNLSKLTQGEIKNLIRPLRTKETESNINSLPKQKAEGLNRFCDEFRHRFKDDIIPILYNLLQKLEAEEILPNSFYKAQHYLNTQDRQGQRRKNQTDRKTRQAKTKGKTTDPYPS